MDKLILFLLVSMCCAIFSCKSDTQVKKVASPIVITDEHGNKLTRVNPDSIENPDDITILRNMHIPIDAGMISTLRTEALTELNDWWKKHDKKSFIALDQDLYVYDRVHNGEVLSAPGQYADYWVDYNEDLTYTYGMNQKELGSGKYYFDGDKMKLLMVDNDENIKPRKYDVKTVGEALIIVGDPQYKDNNFQAKLEKAQQKP